MRYASCVSGARPSLPIHSISYLKEVLGRHNYEDPRKPLVNALVRDHLVLCQDVPVVAQEVLGFLKERNDKMTVSHSFKI